MAWLRMPSTWTLKRGCAPVNCGCTFFPVAQRCCRSPKEMASSGGLTSRLFCSHPYQSPWLSRSASPAVPPPIRAARLRKPGSAWTAASNASRLGCCALQLTAGQRSGTGATPLARASTTQRAWSTWCPCPCGKRAARCPSWRVTRQTAHATLLGVAQEGTGALPVPGFPYRRPGESSSWCLDV